MMPSEIWVCLIEVRYESEVGWDGTVSSGIDSPLSVQDTRDTDVDRDHGGGSGHIFS